MVARSTMTLVMLAIFLIMLGIAWSYPPGSRFMVLVVGLPAVGLCLLQLTLDYFNRDQPQNGTVTEMGLPQTENELPPDVLFRREIIVWGYFLGFIATILFLGFWVAIPILIVSFLWHIAKLRFATSLLTSVIATTLIYVFFGRLLEMRLHPGFLTSQLLEEMEKIESLAPLLRLLG